MEPVDRGVQERRWQRDGEEQLVAHGLRQRLALARARRLAPLPRAQQRAHARLRLSQQRHHSLHGILQKMGQAVTGMQYFLWCCTWMSWLEVKLLYALNMCKGKIYDAG